MNALYFIFAAFAFIWAGAMFYLWRISSLRRHLELKVDRLAGLVAGGEDD